MAFLSVDLLANIRSILIQAGKLALDQPPAVAYQLKPDRTPFTQVELEMEKIIVTFLRATFPDHQVISEENGASGPASSSQWFLDPIDGTKMYLSGGSTWGTSLGLLDHGKPMLGFFYLPKSRDLFWGGPGYGAFYNDIPLSRTFLPDPDDPLVFLGVPASFHRRFSVKYPRVRVLGSTALHLAFVASGASIGALTRRIRLWDVAGILPVLQETGVAAEFLSGTPFSPGDYLDGGLLPEELLVARPAQMDWLRGMIARINP